jgi:hypothetical protein
VTLEGDPALPVLDHPSLAAPSASRPSLSGWGRALALTVAVVAAGGALVGCAAPADGPSGPEPPAQTRQTPLSRHERQALSNLNLLQQVGGRQGGGLKRQQLLWKTRASVPEAYQELRQGHPVYYYSARDAVPHEITDFDSLQRLADQVRQQERERSLREGAEKIEQGLKEIGRTIEREWEDFWREVQED